MKYFVLSIGKETVNTEDIVKKLSDIMQDISNHIKDLSGFRILNQCTVSQGKED